MLRLDKNVVAVVNGEEVKRDKLADLLIDMYGNEGLGMLIRRTLVKQESIKRNVTVTEEEIAERIDSSC
jgi:foldase protein PrsA